MSLNHPMPGSPGSTASRRIPVGPDGCRFPLPCPGLPDVPGSSDRDSISDPVCDRLIEDTVAESRTSALYHSPNSDDGVGGELDEIQGNRLGFLPDRVVNPYRSERPPLRLFSERVSDGHGNDLVHLVSRNLVRSDRPLNPTSLMREPREWLRYVHYDLPDVRNGPDLTAANTGPVRKGTVSDRIAAMLVAPGPPTLGDRDQADSRGEDDQVIGDWVEIFRNPENTLSPEVGQSLPQCQPSADCDDLEESSRKSFAQYPRDKSDSTFAQDHGNDLGAYLSVEEVVAGGTGGLAMIKETGRPVEDAISGNLTGFGVAELLAGYHERHGHFPDPAGFDVAISDSPYASLVDRYLYDQITGLPAEHGDTMVSLTGIPHSGSLRRAG